MIDYVSKNSVVKAKAEILTITLTSDAPNAKLEIEYETFTFIDFVHLLKVEGEWKIASKTYTTILKEF